MCDSNNDNNSNDKSSNIHSFKNARCSDDIYQELCQTLLEGLEYYGSGEKLLENLYYGNLHIADNEFYGKYRENLEKLCGFTQKMEESLTSAQKELYERVSKQNDCFIDLCESQTFIRAFRLGARIMQAVYEGNITRKRLSQMELLEITSSLKRMIIENGTFDKTSTQEAFQELSNMQNEFVKKLPENLRDEMTTLIELYRYYIKRVKSDAFMDGLEYSASPDPVA